MFVNGASADATDDAPPTDAFHTQLPPLTRDSQDTTWRLYLVLEYEEGQSPLAVIPSVMLVDASTKVPAI